MIAMIQVSSSDDHEGNTCMLLKFTVTEDPSDEGKSLTDEGKSHYVRNGFQNVFYYSSDRRSIR